MEQFNNNTKERTIIDEVEQFPQQFLHNFCMKKKWGKPVYEVTEEKSNKQFVCKVTVNLQEFKGAAESSIRMAKTNAASVCLSELKRIGYIIQ